MRKEFLKITRIHKALITNTIQKNALKSTKNLRQENKNRKNYVSHSDVRNGRQVCKSKRFWAQNPRLLRPNHILFHHFYAHFILQKSANI